MTQEFREQVSALMDGEVRRDEARFLLQRLGHDAALAADWLRWHVARDMLRRQSVGLVPARFAAGVMTRIDAVSISSRHDRPWWHWGAGGAIAAAVAIVALTVTRPVVDQAPPAPTAGTGSTAATQSASVALANRQIDVAPVTASTARQLPASVAVPPIPMEPASASVDSMQADAAYTRDPQLQSYLERHFEATGSVGQSGFVPYVLLIAPASKPGAPAPERPVDYRR